MRRPMSSGQLAVIGLLLFICAGVLYTEMIFWPAYGFNITGAMCWIAAIVTFIRNKEWRR